MKILCFIFGHVWKPKSMHGKVYTFYRCSRCLEGKYIQPNMLEEL